MAIRQLSAAATHAELGAKSGAVYLDVRTPEEFTAGHPAGAQNVPVMLFDPATRRPVPVADFVAIVAGRFPATTPLLVGCQSGMRSQRACEMLADAGFTDLANVAGGFGGSPDEPGWRDAGLPVESGPERT